MEVNSNVDAHVTFQCDGETFVFLMYGRIGPEAAMANGRISYEGDEELVSAFVQRYLAGVKDRTKARWETPEDTPPDQLVKLRFSLDVTGSATHIEYVDGPRSLAPSVIEALRAAAPFPPMDDNVRCLSEIRLIATFTANESR